jgi:hypothetical protein
VWKGNLPNGRNANTFPFGAGQFCYTCSRDNPSSNLYVMYFTFRELALFQFLKGLLWVETFIKRHYAFETSATYFTVDIAKDSRILQSSAITL